MGCQQSSEFVENAEISQVDGHWKLKDYLPHPGMDTNEELNDGDDDVDDEDDKGVEKSLERDNSNYSELAPNEMPQTKPMVVVLSGRLNSLTDDFTIDRHHFRHQSRQQYKADEKMDSFHVRRGLTENASHITNAATGEDVAILKRSKFSTVGYSLFSFKPSFANRRPSSVNLDDLLRGAGKRGSTRKVTSSGPVFLHGILEKNWSESSMKTVAFDYYVVRSLPSSISKNESDEEAGAVRRHKCRIVYHVPRSWSSHQDTQHVLVHVEDAKTGEHLAYVHQKARTFKTAIADLERIVIRMGGGVDALSLSLMIYAVIKIMAPGR